MAAKVFFILLHCLLATSLAQASDYGVDGTRSIIRTNNIKLDTYSTSNFTLSKSLLASELSVDMEQAVVIHSIRPSADFTKMIMAFLGMISKVYIIDMSLDGISMQDIDEDVRIQMTYAEDDNEIRISQTKRVVDPMTGNLKVSFKPLGRYPLKLIR